jgi:hypothetical protein
MTEIIVKNLGYSVGSASLYFGSGVTYSANLLPSSHLHCKPVVMDDVKGACNLYYWSNIPAVPWQSHLGFRNLPRGVQMLVCHYRCHWVVWSLIVLYTHFQENVFIIIAENHMQVKVFWVVVMWWCMVLW